jgi:hypothetical protein
MCHSIQREHPAHDVQGTNSRYLGGDDRHTGRKLLATRIVQRVIQPRNHPGGIAKRWMGGDVLDPLPIDPNLARVADAFEVFGAGERARAMRS